ncbi:murein DD-endopeptidase MepM/ murein hydrolase activator NlpD [Algoriphagus aquaeductus]|jgi:murein DD-endopeptidase MepM/ murein hydrolase activator NlpD|uniref:Murein DD-endopeptidase MepM/ murein hydrolase activator NlpD n=1 Tax=Algoriphagus aquaeductus TaxID=475299 RepID=A0A326RY27_9BACT|nr:M23 family metallopeptidase [Algoriphagus aquaeductus]PZV80359.1 murein DD-endopeptidase MepM/ murein hydrolase activator NlpD [Algoriphagus aquaeductus]
MRSYILKFILGSILSIGLFEANAQVFPKIIKKNPNTSGPTQERRNIELREFDQESYLKTLSTQTDSLLFQNNVNLSRIRSIISEDPFAMSWAPTNQLIQISEQIQIDSIWVTAFEYFSSWDSKKVDIYNLDIRNFQDSLVLKLYDLKYGQNWKMPLDYLLVNSRFGPRWGRMHSGTDLDLNTGDPVYSAFDGIVRVRAYDRYGYGYYYVVRHKNGLETLYGHLSKHVAEVGQEVKAGDFLGKGGSTGRSTGPHLHYELRYKGLAFDPETVYDFEKGELSKQELLVSKDLFGHIAKARAAAYHRVKRGDTLGAIAKRYGVPISQITRLNGISTRTTLRIGQNLRVK